MKLSAGDIVLLAIVGTLILLPTLQYEPYGIDHLYNVKRFVQVGLLFLVGGMLLCSLDLRVRTAKFIGLFSSNIQIALAAVAIIGGISCLFAELGDWAFLEYAHYLLIIIATFVVGAVTYNEPQKAVMYLKVAVLGFVFFYLCRVAFFYVLFQLGEVPLWPGELNWKALYSFSNVRFFNQTQTWTIPILASLGWYYWCYSDIYWKRWGLGAIIIGWGMLVFASGARGTIFGVITGIILMWGILVVNKKRFFIYHSFLAACAGIGFFIFFKLLGSSLKQTSVRAGTSNRFEKWLELMPEIIDKSLLGYGPMHFSSFPLDNWSGHPHNWLIQFGYEWGLVAAVILLGLFIVGMVVFGQRLKSHEKEKEISQECYWIRLGLLWSMIAAFVHGFFSGLAVMPLSQTWFILVVGMSMGLYYRDLKDESVLPEGNTSKVKAIIVGITLVSFIGFIQWTFYNPIDRNERNRYYYDHSNSSRSQPRYWQQGIIGFDYSGMEKEEPQTAADSLQEQQK